MHYDHMPTDKQAMVRTLAMPKDTNALGDIFGGWLMANADMAAAIPATQRAEGRVVTVAVNDFQFLSPVYVGDVVSFYADIDHVGTTSMRIDVTVFSSRMKNSTEKQIKVATATMTYVHVGDDRRPAPIKNTENG